MEEITIKLPDGYKTILDEIDDPIYIEAIKSIAKSKLKEKKKRTNELLKQITRYEKKYQMKYEAFSQDVPDSFEGHEDWMDWTYLHETYQQLNRAVDKFELLLSK